MSLLGVLMCGCLAPLLSFIETESMFELLKIELLMLIVELVELEGL